MSSAEKYTTAAFLVFLVVVCLYLAIFSFKASRLEREVGELGRRQPERRGP
jgi:hypothetical protein